MAVERGGPRRRNVRTHDLASADLLDLLVLVELFFDDDGAAKNVTPKVAAESPEGLPPPYTDRET